MKERDFIKQVLDIKLVDKEYVRQKSINTYQIKNKKGMLFMKKHVLISIIIAFVFILTVGAIVTQNFFTLGNKVNDIKNDKIKNTTVIALVNDEPILKSNFDIKKVLNEFAYTQNLKHLEALKNSLPNDIYEKNKSKLNQKSDKELLDELIRNCVIFQEALKLGISATDEEVQAYISSMKAISTTTTDDTNNTNQNTLSMSVSTLNQQSNDNYNEYISGLGITKDEYEKEQTGEIKKNLIMNKLWLNFKDDLTKSGKAGAKTYNELYLEFTKYVDQLVKKSNIVYK